VGSRPTGRRRPPHVNNSGYWQAEAQAGGTEAPSTATREKSAPQMAVLRKAVTRSLQNGTQRNGKRPSAAVKAKRKHPGRQKRCSVTGAERLVCSRRALLWLAAPGQL